MLYYPWLMKSQHMFSPSIGIDSVVEPTVFSDYVCFYVNMSKLSCQLFHRFGCDSFLIPSEHSLVHARITSLVHAMFSSLVRLPLQALSSHDVGFLADEEVFLCAQCRFRGSVSKIPSPPKLSFFPWPHGVFSPATLPRQVP